MPTIKVTPEIEEKIIQLHRANQNYRNIGRQLGLDWRTVKGVVSRGAQIREQKHWEAVTHQVDTEFLRQHYRVLMLLAQEVWKVLSYDPIEPGHAEAKVCLAIAQDRAVRWALDHDILPGMPQVKGTDGTTGDLSQAHLGYMLFQALQAHEPKLKTLIIRWTKSWDALLRLRERLESQVKESLPGDEYLKIGLTPTQAAKNLESALTEALECKLKDLRLMEFETPSKETNVFIGRLRKDPKIVRPIYIGRDLEGAQAWYQKALGLALQQPEVWDRLGNAYQGVIRWAGEVKQVIDTLAIRGRPGGMCTYCPSAASLEPSWPRDDTLQMDQADNLEGSYEH